MTPMNRVHDLTSWIYAHAAGAQGLLVPVSGGSDSALGFWACMRAFPDKTFGIHAGSRATLRRSDWFRSVGPVRFVRTPGDHDAREEMRWASFLATSLKNRWWLVGCRNRTEQELGTYSLASRVMTFAPLIGTYKSDVMRMCEAIGVPEEIMASSRRADPDCGRPAEMAEIPFELIDAFLAPSRHPGLAGELTAAQSDYLQGVMNRNDFKRGLPVRGPNL